MKICFRIQYMGNLTDRQTKFSRHLVILHLLQKHSYFYIYAWCPHSGHRATCYTNISLDM